jgi:hypothetical protein
MRGCSSLIRHVVMFKFREQFDQESRQDWARRAKKMPEQIKEIRAFSLGFDILGIDRSWDAAIVADFDTIDDVRAYAIHPAHLPVAAISVPNCEEMVSVDFELEPSNP